MKACQICLSIYEDSVKFCPFHGVELKHVPGTNFNSGDKVANYFLRSQIGRDGLGDIFCATRDQGTYRFRVFHEGILLDSNRFSRLQQILEKSTHISGGGIPIVDFGMIGAGDFFCAHPYIPGRSFQEIIDLNHNLSESDIAILLHQLLNAVKDIHAQRMIHGNMSLRTTIIDNAGHVRLYDAGLWDILRDEHFNELCEDHAEVLADIIDLMAPEVAHGNAPQPYSDVYSCGAAAYSLLTRQTGSGSASYRYRMHYDGVAKDTRSIQNINPDFVDLIMAAMNGSSNVRFQTPKAFITALHSVHPEIDVHAESLPSVLAQNLLSGAEKPISAMNRAVSRRSHTINDTHLDTSTPFDKRLDTPYDTHTPFDSHTPFDTHRFAQSEQSASATDTTQRIIQPTAEQLEFADTVVEKTNSADLSSLIGDALGKDTIFDDLERALTTEMDPFESQPTQEIPQPLFAAPAQNASKSAEDVFSGLLNRTLSENNTTQSSASSQPEPSKPIESRAATKPAAPAPVEKSAEVKPKTETKQAKAPLPVIEKPKAEEKKPQAEDKKPQAEDKKPQAEDKKPQAEDKKPKAEDKKPQAEDKKPQAEDKKPQAEIPKALERGDIVTLPNDSDMRRLKRRKRRDIKDVEPKNEVVVANTVIKPLSDPSTKPPYSKLPSLTVTSGFHGEEEEVIEEDVLPHMLGLEQPANTSNAAESASNSALHTDNAAPQTPQVAEASESGDEDIAAGFFDADNDENANADNANLDWFGEEPLSLKKHNNKSKYIKVAAIALLVLALAGGAYAILQSSPEEQTDNAEQAWAQKIQDFNKALAEKTPESRATAKSLFSEIRNAPLDQKTIQECRENYISALKSQAESLKESAKTAEDIPDPLDLTDIYDILQTQYLDCLQKIEPDAADADSQKQDCADIESSAKEIALQQGIEKATELKPEYESQVASWTELESIYKDISSQMRGSHDAALAEALNTASQEKENFQLRLKTLQAKSEANPPKDTAVAVAEPDNPEPAEAAPDTPQEDDARVAANEPEPQPVVEQPKAAMDAIQAPEQPVVKNDAPQANAPSAPEPVLIAKADMPKENTIPKTLLGQDDSPKPAEAKAVDPTPSVILNPQPEPEKAADTAPAAAPTEQPANNKKFVILVDDDPAPAAPAPKPKSPLLVDNDEVAPFVLSPKKQNTDTSKSAAVDSKSAAADNKDTPKEPAKAEAAPAAQPKPAEAPKQADNNAGSGDKVPVSKLIADAQAAMSKKDFDAAVQLLVQATTREPNNARAWLTLAKANDLRGKHDLAIASAEKACKLQKSASNYIYLGDLYRKTGDAANAKAAYEQAQAIDPNNSALKTRLQ